MVSGTEVKQTYAKSLLKRREVNKRRRGEGLQEIAGRQPGPIGSMVCWTELQEEREGADQIACI